MAGAGLVAHRAPGAWRTYDRKFSCHLYWWGAQMVIRDCPDGLRLTFSPFLSRVGLTWLSPWRCCINRRLRA
ncbi:hypothetical protein CJO78_23780 (plasmid) [Ralstonia solanacearum]|nr:hypothetical protein CJO78_23780 [Ralstonia solanacearum]AXW08715.1 hypothetical protein CJO82_23450 [Ralstonia solanacearum]AXW26499.1 hypothetical protein CJO86_23720 [Ralstonia solanacearum]AXW83415.1 hypothetical protein CJO98_23810 [Ralstonia solanacearum]